MAAAMFAIVASAALTGAALLLPKAIADQAAPALNNQTAVATCVLFPQLAFDLFLRDGTPVLLRCICPEDARLLGIFYSRLSDRTVYQRYFHGVSLASRASEAGLRQYCSADPRVECKLVALRSMASGENEVIAIAEIGLLRAAPRTMEWGLVIADQFQRSGLGKQICDHLLLVSRQAGAERIQCFALFDNLAVMRLARRFGFVLNYAGGGLIQGEFSL